MGAARSCAACLMLAFACASARPAKQRPPQVDPPQKQVERTHDIHRGVFHQVRKGETLFAIGRVYGVSADEIRIENGIADPAQVAAGSLVFVPRAERTIEMPAEAKVGPRPRRAQPSQIARAGTGPLDPAAHGAPLAWPLHGVLVSAFGMRDTEQHEGIDLAAPEGTPVLAAQSGKVLFAGFQRGYGNLVLVGHDGGLVTIYAHNAENLVAAGDPVARGQRIARVGRSGNATGPHLHFEVRVGTRPRDPLHFLR
ncbi:MAG: LysM peptidoglycan-binding domain-containing M23 family metallopeptidase [Myxococcales bacterium]